MRSLMTRYQMDLAPDLDSPDKLVRYVQKCPHAHIHQAIVGTGDHGVLRLTFDVYAPTLVDMEKVNEYINSFYQRKG